MPLRPRLASLLPRPDGSRVISSLASYPRRVYRPPTTQAAAIAADLYDSSVFVNLSLLAHPLALAPIEVAHDQLPGTVVVAAEDLNRLVA